MNESVRKGVGVEDAYLKNISPDGYGNPDMIRQIINMEGGVDAILHYTDPRFWGWLYQMEHELRRTHQYFTIIYGMIYLIQDGMNHSMKVVI